MLARSPSLISYLYGFCFHHLLRFSLIFSRETGFGSLLQLASRVSSRFKEILGRVATSVLDETAQCDL